MAQSMFQSPSRGPLLGTLLVAIGCAGVAAGELPLVTGVEWQPLSAQVQRITDALEAVGAPLAQADWAKLRAALAGPGGVDSSEAMQRILDSYCLLGVEINPESRVKVAAGAAKAVLVEQGWRVFLVKVQNDAGVTAELRATSPNRAKLAGSPASEVANR